MTRNCATASDFGGISDEEIVFDPGRSAIQTDNGTSVVGGLMDQLGLPRFGAQGSIPGEDVIGESGRNAVAQDGTSVAADFAARDQKAIYPRVIGSGQNPASTLAIQNGLVFP